MQTEENCDPTERMKAKKKNFLWLKNSALRSSMRTSEFIGPRYERT